MNKKIAVFIILSSLFFGAIGSWIFNRYVVPRLNAIPFLVKYNLAPSAGLLVIKTTEQVRVNDGSDTIAAIQSAKPWVVGLLAANDLSNAKITGSGLILTSDGLIATTKSALPQNIPANPNQNQANFYAKFLDGSVLPAKVVANDSASDLVFIKVSGANLATAAFGAPKDMQLGQKLILLNAALGQFQITDAISDVTSELRNLDSNDVISSDQLHRTFGIEPGNFPEAAVIISNDGNVQGLYSKSGIIISDTIKSAMQSYFENQKIIRNSFGLHYQYVPGTVAGLFKNQEGVLIKHAANAFAVVPGSPAAQSGILEGDLIYKVDGTQINFDNSFEELINKHAPNEVVSLELIRGGVDKVINLIVKAK